MVQFNWQCEKLLHSNPPRRSFRLEQNNIVIRFQNVHNSDKVAWALHDLCETEHVCKLLGGKAEHKMVNLRI